jgi:hypothetical protein
LLLLLLLCQRIDLHGQLLRQLLLLLLLWAGAEGTRLLWTSNARLLLLLQQQCI